MAFVWDSTSKTEAPFACGRGLGVMQRSEARSRQDGPAKEMKALGSPGQAGPWAHTLTRGPSAFCKAYRAGKCGECREELSRWRSGCRANQDLGYNTFSMPGTPGITTRLQAFWTAAPLCRHTEARRGWNEVSGRKGRAGSGDWFRNAL